MRSQFEIIFLISLFSATEQCLKTLPPEEIYITSTTPLFETTTVNLCNDCDIRDVVKNQFGDKFTIILGQPVLVNNCIQITIICQSDDGCRTVTLFAASGGKTVEITTPSKDVSAKFFCEKNGEFSSDKVKDIEDVTCVCTR